MIFLGMASAVLDPAALRWARHGVASQGLGQTWRGPTWQNWIGRGDAGRGKDSTGGRQPSGFEALTPTRGGASHDDARRGVARQDVSWHHLTRQALAVLRLAWHGNARQVSVRRGLARTTGRLAGIPVRARNVHAGRAAAVLDAARPGSACRGKDITAAPAHS